MTPQTFPRAQRRRSSCPSFFWVLVLAWAVLMAGFNVARVLTLPEFFVRFTPREEVANEINYYEMLNVSPLVDDETLRQLRRRHLLDMHPDKVGHSPGATERFIILHDVFETLTDDKRRCEYDRAHRIKGKWPTYTCRYTFRGQYRPIAQEIREKWMEVLKNEKKGTSGNEEDDKQESPDLESEPASPPLKVKPLKPKAGKPSKASRLRSENKRPTSPDTQARPAVTVVTVEVEPEAKGAVATVTSAVAQC
ncbi:hypothetical protein FJTKL_00123 [Diaporthe vaccinii]|uniref:J domain-containing protein n=1 Tax=Diaporthe vaccinii TaxID=105482 RepID=A0ABR4E4D8_9PEZI